MGKNTNVAGTVYQHKPLKKRPIKFKKCENSLCHMTLNRRATSPPLFSKCKLLAVSSALDRNGPRASAVKLEAQLAFIIIYLQSQPPGSSRTATITRLEHNKHIRLPNKRKEGREGGKALQKEKQGSLKSGPGLGTVSGQIHSRQCVRESKTTAFFPWSAVPCSYSTAVRHERHVLSLKERWSEYSCVLPHYEVIRGYDSVPLLSYLC